MDPCSLYVVVFNKIRELYSICLNRFDLMSQFLPTRFFERSNDRTSQQQLLQQQHTNDTKATMHGRTMVSSVSFLLAVVGTRRTTMVEGHGYLFEPASRNYWSNVHGKDYGLERGRPSPREYCFHCLNTNTGVCGTSEQGVNYGTLY